MMTFDDYLPQRINQGPWLTAYARPVLLDKIRDTSITLPICRLGTPWSAIAACGELVLPPLYSEALTDPLRDRILQRIDECFPFLAGTAERAAWNGRLEVVELDQTPPAAEQPIDILAFSVDTAVEEHGPHLPLATDTIQSYGVLRQLAGRDPRVVCGPPVEYGQLTWGLPFGLSIDLTADLLTSYVRNFADAALDYFQARALYVVDVHGSIVHRTAIQRGLEASRAPRWRFRWLHEPLVEFAGERGDQHAGGVETAVVELLDSRLVDARWWPSRLEELARDQMDMQTAIKLSSDLPQFVEQTRRHGWNGIVGDVRNYAALDAAELLSRMLRMAEADVAQL